MYSRIAFASSTRVFQRCRSSSSICIEDQNDGDTRGHPREVAWRVATCTVRPSSAATAMASNRLVGHHPPQQLTGPPVHRQLSLQLGDPPLGRGELGLLRRRQPRRLASVDAVLAAPGVDRLFADPEVEAASASVRPLAGPALCAGTPADTHDVPRGPPSRVKWHQSPANGLRGTRGTPPPWKPGRFNSIIDG